MTRIELPLTSDPSVEKNHSIPPVVSPCIWAGGIARNWNSGCETKSLSVPANAAALSIETIAAPAIAPEIIIGDEDGILVEARLLDSRGSSETGEVVGRQEPVERVAVVRHRQEQPVVPAVEGRDVPAVGDVVVHDVDVAAARAHRRSVERGSSSRMSPVVLS